MATRIYLPSSGAAAVTPSTWNHANQASTTYTLAGVRTKGSTAMTSRTTASGTTSPYTRAVMRYVFGPIAAQTIAGTINAVMRCSEAATGANATMSIAVKIIQSGGADRAVLLAATASDSASSPYEFSTSLYGRRAYNASESRPISLTSQSATEGDYLVVELGFRSATTTTRNVVMHHGDNVSTDMVDEDGSNTNDYAPWIEFSQTLNFMAETLVVAESAHAHAADNVVLQPHLVVSESRHLHAADNVILTLPVPGTECDLYIDWHTGADGDLITDTIAAGSCRPTSPTDVVDAYPGTTLTAMKIETDSASPVTGLVACDGVGYDIGDTTQGAIYDHTGDYEDIVTADVSSAPSVMSMGFMYKTDMDTGWAWHAMAGINGSGEWAILAPRYFSSQQHFYLHTSQGYSASAVDVSNNTWYWITIQYNRTAGYGYMEVYLASTMAKVGSTLSLAFAASPPTVDYWQIGQSANQGNLEAASSWFGPAIFDWTDGTFPLLPEAGEPTLVVSECAHAHATDAIGLIQQNVLAAQEALHTHTTDGIALVQQSTLAVEDAAHSTSPQLINDGGFERWTSLTNLAQWSEQKGGTTRIERSTSEKQEGTSSVAFIGDGSGSYARLSQTITLQVNTVYTMRIRHKASAAVIAAQLTLTNNSTGHALDASGSWTGPYLWLNIDTSWSEEGWISWKTESTGTSFNLELYVSGGSFANQTIWFDMFTISKDLLLTPHLVVADATHAHAADTPTLVQQHLIIVSEATHAQLAESPTLVQQHLLAVAEALHAHAAEVPTLTQQHLLAVSECLHAHLADNVVLQTAGALQVQDATHAHAAETPSLVQQHTLAVDESWHSHFGDHQHVTDGSLEKWNSATDLWAWLEDVQGTSSINRSGPSWNYCAEIRIDASNSLGEFYQMLTSVAADKNYRLGFWWKTTSGKEGAAFVRVAISGVNYYLQPDGVTWLTAPNYDCTGALSNVAWQYTTLSFKTPVGMTAGSCLFGFYAGLDLSSASGSFFIDDAVLTDEMKLTPTFTLAVAEANHLHASDVVALVQQHVLAVQEARHLHAADNVTLSFSAILVVADAQHAHLAGEIVLSMLGYFDLIVVNVNPRERIVEVRLHERIQDAQQRERIVETRPRERVVDSDVRERIIEAEDLR